MNRFIQNLFIILFPFYPLWAWACYSLVKKPVDVFVNILLLPFAVYFLIKRNKKLPKYLNFFIIFTIYHLCSVLINDSIPENENWLYFILNDINVLACTLLLIVENISFDNRFISKMNRSILVIILISLIVSLIQIKNPLFFFNVDMDKQLIYIEENRNFSIYSWVSLNSVGITFPILIAILLSFYNNKSKAFLLIIFSGIIVPFLTRGRYIMMSSLVAISQLFFTTKKSFTQKALSIFLLVSSIFFLNFVAGQFGYDINEVINNRIIEKESDFASAKARITSYHVFLLIFPEHPFFGVGPKTRPEVIDLLNEETLLIHIGYLSYLYYYGIIGSIFLFLALYHLLKRAWFIGKKHNFWGSFYGIVSFCLANLTMVYFNFSEMGIIIAVIYLRYYKIRTSKSIQLYQLNNENQSNSLALVCQRKTALTSSP